MVPWECLFCQNDNKFYKEKKFSLLEENGFIFLVKNNGLSNFCIHAFISYNANVSGVSISKKESKSESSLSI